MFSLVFFMFSSVFFCFLYVLEVFTSVTTSPYPFYFVFLLRVTSNREVVRFEEVAVLKQISMLPPKTLFISARTSDCFEKHQAHAQGYYLTFIS